MSEAAEHQADDITTVFTVSMRSAVGKYLRLTRRKDIPNSIAFFLLEISLTVQSAVSFGNLQEGNEILRD